MSQHIDVLIFLLVVGLSFVNWIVGQIKEKREIEKINRKRAEQRENASGPASGQSSGRAAGGGAAPAGASSGGGSLAERRRERLRELRAKQAERTREQVEVMTGQRHAGARTGTGTGTGGRGAPTRAQPVPTRGTQRGGGGGATAGPRPGGGTATGPGGRRPVRPGRTARKTGPGDVSREEIGAGSGERESAPRTLTETATPLSKAFTPLSERSPDLKPVVRAGNVDWRRAIVLSEVLAPPVSMRPLDMS